MPVSVAAVAASGSNPGTAANTYSGTIQVQIQDENGNPMAAGTTVNAVLNNTGIGTLGVTQVTIGCETDLGGFLFQFAFTSATAGGSGTITVTVTSPNGTISSFPIGITVTQ